MHPLRSSRGSRCGKIDDFMVMVRPLSAATALAQAMGAQFEQIQQEAAEQIQRQAVQS